MKNLALSILLLSIVSMAACKASKKSTPNYGHQKSESKIKA